VSWKLLTLTPSSGHFKNYTKVKKSSKTYFILCHCKTERFKFLSCLTRVQWFFKDDANKNELFFAHYQYNKKRCSMLVEILSNAIIINNLPANLFMCKEMDKRNFRFNIAQYLVLTEIRWKWEINKAQSEKFTVNLIKTFFIFGCVIWKNL
jgi:hypothetical protein